MHDSKVQQATILFNDRINCFLLMKALDANLDENPTAKKVKELAELRIRNLAAYRELQALNETGDFVYKHIIIRQYGKHAQLALLRKNDPEKFMDDYHLAKDNVKRYKTYLKKDNRSEKQHETDAQLLEKWKETCQVFVQVLNS